MFARLIDWFGKHRSALALVWLLFLVPRLAVLFFDVAPTSDADWYYSQGVNLARGEGYLEHGQPTAYWPVGWPLMIAATLRALGESVLAVGLLNLASSLLTGAMLLDLSKRIYGTQLAARVALLLYAVYPNAIGYVPLAMTEVFYTMLLVAICWLLAVRQGWAARIAAGLLLGLASLVKAQTLVVVPLILGIGLLREAGFWKRLPRAIGLFAALIALAGAVVLPWSLRNQRELGAFVMVSTNGGLTLLTGNNDTVKDGGFTQDDPLVMALRAKNLPELAEDAEAKRLAMTWIAAHPGRFIELMPRKLLKLWATDGEAQWAYELGLPGYAAQDRAFDLVRLANQAFYWALLVLFMLAAWVMFRLRRREGARLIDWWLLPYGIAAFPSAVAMVFSGQSRFHFPAMPFVCLAAGWLIAHWLTRRAKA